MKKTIVAFAFGLAISAGIGKFMQDPIHCEPNLGSRELENENRRLKSRIAELEAKSKSVPVAKAAATPSSPSPASEPQARTEATTMTVSPKATPVERIVDDPAPGSASCTFAMIKQGARLATGMTWNIENGASFIGDLPAGTIVEILSIDLPYWTDYPDEHGVYVAVVESPKAPQMLYQRGYIELRQIDHRRCKLGAEFDK